MGAPAPWSNNDIWEEEYVEDLRVFILSVMMPMRGSFSSLSSSVAHMSAGKWGTENGGGDVVRLASHLTSLHRH